MSSLAGVYAPIISPFKQDEVFDYEGLASNAARLFAAGVDGLYLCGGTGDAGCLRAEERKKALETVLPMAKATGKGVLVHVGLTHQRDAVALAGHAAEMGADAVAAIPPDGDPVAIVSFYKALAAVGLPTFVYHIPAVTHRHPPFEELLEILSIPGVAGMKMTDWNLFNMRRLRIERPDAILYNGCDEMTALGLMYGANGSIGTWQNLLPEVFVSIFAAVKAGDLHRAMRIQDAFTAFLHIAWQVGVIEAFDVLMQDAGYMENCFRAPGLTGDRGRVRAVLPVLRRAMEEIRKTIEEA